MYLGIYDCKDCIDCKYMCYTDRYGVDCPHWRNKFCSEGCPHKVSDGTCGIIETTEKRLWGKTQQIFGSLYKFIPPKVKSVDADKVPVIPLESKPMDLYYMDFI